MEKLYCGLDIHKEKIAGCILNGNGEISRAHIFPFSRKAVESLYGKPRDNNLWGYVVSGEEYTKF